MVKTVIKNDNNNIIFYLAGKALSSTVSGSGNIHAIVFNTLNQFIRIEDFDIYLESIVHKYDLGRNTPVFVTLVDVNDIEIYENDEFLIAVTAGISEPASFYSSHKHGTINVLVALKRKPVKNAMADLFRVVTEAKSMAAFSLGLQFNGIPSPGTVSDAICVVFTGDKKIRYCGFGTETGNKITKKVYEMVYRTGKKYIDSHNARS
ncbi:adenosylcobinamide amidohydrolase [Ferroplasma sp.]|uniref:adenosylcobinamide amidohydrolase n=1 Tax=Ferroplasma sp. TaxID=2591003 RepID=UPI00307E0550